MKIGNNPVSKNLARILEYEKYISPTGRRNREFEEVLTELHNEIKQRYPGDNKDQCKPASVLAWLGGRPAKFESLRKIAEIKGIDVFDLYVDRGKWINLESILDAQKQVIANILRITDPKPLGWLKSASSAAIDEKTEGQFSKQEEASPLISYTESVNSHDVSSK
uniref:Uncharacterized protein n=1 Tax=viral metagenome TaxID=1070528 RepID=A0A6M3IX82_9ZZZZ